jgi:hypothetical protein
MAKTLPSRNDMRDTGPDGTKASIQGMLDKFLDDDSPLDRDKSAAGDDRSGAGGALRAGQELTTEASHASIDAITPAVGRIGVQRSYHARTRR